MEMLDFLGRCEPFGVGNRNPVWRIPKVTVLPQTRMVGGRHLKLFVRGKGGVTAEGISFGWASRSATAGDLHGKTVDLAATLAKGYYLKRHYTEIRVLDIRECED